MGLAFVLEKLRLCEGGTGVDVNIDIAADVRNGNLLYWGGFG